MKTLPSKSYFTDKNIDFVLKNFKDILKAIMIKKRIRKIKNINFENYNYLKPVFFTMKF